MGKEFGPEWLQIPDPDSFDGKTVEKETRDRG